MSHCCTSIKTPIICVVHFTRRLRWKAAAQWWVIIQAARWRNPEQVTPSPPGLICLFRQVSLILQAAAACTAGAGRAVKCQLIQRQTLLQLIISLFLPWASIYFAKIICNSWWMEILNFSCMCLKLERRPSAAADSSWWNCKPGWKLGLYICREKAKLAATEHKHSRKNTARSV